MAPRDILWVFPGDAIIVIVKSSDSAMRESGSRSAPPLIVKACDPVSIRNRQRPDEEPAGGAKTISSSRPTNASLRR